MTAPGMVADPQRNSVLLSSSSRPARPGRTPASIVIAIAVIGAILLSAAGPIVRSSVASADGPPPLGDTTFYGRGYGHGVGMSQYGARGRALAGQLAPEILAHYYSNTTLATKSISYVLRVLLLTGFKATATKPLTVVGLTGTFTIDGIDGTFPKGAKVTLAPTASNATTWTLRVRSSDGVSIATKTVSGSVFIKPTTTTSLLQLVSKPTTYNLYRGYFRVRLTTTAMVINHVTIERYLRGVVPLEMPSSWPTEALKAQAIAARSYALYHRHPSTGDFDVYDDTRSQLYRGRKAETTAGSAAVTGTAGVVLLNGTTIVNALFHSADGGWTEDNENVFVSASGSIVAGPLSYLRGVSDRAPDGSSWDKASPYATWKTATYSAAALSAIFAKDPRTNVGALTAIDLSERGVSGRLVRVTLTGELGSKTVSGNVFRSVFNAGRPTTDPQMRSTLVDTAPIP